ncbi:hypothetical protein TcBrA4_0039430 [Trypanosoma cruzi]|nr:hypothetical protein TcBrA4_0039430 [Trypanosoma cruzi]
MSDDRPLKRPAPFWGRMTQAAGRTARCLSLSMRLDPLHCHFTPRTAELPVGPHRAAAGSLACFCQAECPVTEYGLGQFPVPRLAAAAASQSPARVPAATDSLSAMETLRLGSLAVHDEVTEEISLMPHSLADRDDTLLAPHFHHDAAESQATSQRTLTPSCHDPSRRTASMPGTWASSLQSGDGTGRMPRRKRKARTPRDRRLSVWRNSIPGVDPDIGSRVAALRTGAMRLLPTLRQACTRPADHKEPSVSVVPSLPDYGDRPASASAGTSSRRERRDSLSTSERRIDVLLPTCGRVRLSVHSMRAHAGRAQPGVPIVCEGLPCGCHNGATVFLTGASRAGRHRSCQACQQARHAGSTNAGTRDGPGSYATASSRTPRAADSTTDHGKLRFIHCGHALSLGIWTVTVWDCPSPHHGPFATE